MSPNDVTPNTCAPMNARIMSILGKPKKGDPLNFGKPPCLSFAVLRAQTGQLAKADEL